MTDSILYEHTFQTVIWNIHFYIPKHFVDHYVERDLREKYFVARKNGSNFVYIHKNLLLYFLVFYRNDIVVVSVCIIFHIFSYIHIYFALHYVYELFIFIYR